jgi:hypothetical protein
MSGLLEFAMCGGLVLATLFIGMVLRGLLRVFPPYP